MLPPALKFVFDQIEKRNSIWYFGSQPKRLTKVSVGDIFEKGCRLLENLIQANQFNYINCNCNIVILNTFVFNWIISKPHISVRAESVEIKLYITK